jgi:hypothetical protein
MVELERFRLEGAALVVTCGRCGVETPVAPGATPSPSPGAAEARPVSGAFPATPAVMLVSQPGASNVVSVRSAASDAVASAAQATERAFAVPDQVCPKCIAPRGTGPACGSCGLIYSQLGPGGVEVPTWLQTLWVELLRDWGNEAKHDQTRRFASQRGGLAELGRLYRLALVRSPADPFAEQGRAEILRMAAMGVSLRPPGEPSEPAAASRVKVTAVAVVLVMTIVAMGYLLTVLLKQPTG